METHRFYTPEYEFTEKLPLADGLILSEEESHHACKVLRLKIGDIIELINGKGWIARACIVDAHPKRSLCKITQTAKATDQPSKIHIAVAPPKNISRFEWFLEKATEIGIGQITPLICQRSERQRLNTDRLEKIILAAMKQSKRSWKPILHHSVSFKEMLSTELEDQKMIALLNENSMPLSSVYDREKPALVMIGPEGDFTEEESATAIEMGFKSVLLGTSRLRTETAALYACTNLNILNVSNT